ncbi:MAG: hypothetical protein ACFB10_15315 [Salibacteraceae bacterium]
MENSPDIQQNLFLNDPANQQWDNLIDLQGWINPEMISNVVMEDTRTIQVRATKAPGKISKVNAVFYRLKGEEFIIVFLQGCGIDKVPYPENPVMA